MVVRRDEVMPGGPYKDPGTGIGNIMEKIDKAFKIAAKAVVPVLKTTNMEVIHRESGFPKASLALAQARQEPPCQQKSRQEDCGSAHDAPATNDRAGRPHDQTFPLRP